MKIPVLSLALSPEAKTKVEECSRASGLSISRIVNELIMSEWSLQVRFKWSEKGPRK
jgi:hypothetical protein